MSISKSSMQSDMLAVAVAVAGKMVAMIIGT